MRLFVLYLILNGSAVIYFQLFKAKFSLLLQLSLFNKMISLLASHLRFSCYDCFWLIHNFKVISGNFKPVFVKKLAEISGAE